jgi:LuxR family maltose regulon positive regulatory protein
MVPGAEFTGANRVGPLLKTKLEAPDCPRLVVRECLLEALSTGKSKPVTLVYGPAGSGKTMLVAQWRAATDGEIPVAWLSLDPGDADPTRFWTYFIEAMRSVRPGFGQAALAMLGVTGVAFAADVLPKLVNELVDLPGPSTLVLEDYHAIDDARIDADMTALLAHLPSTLRIVITSRVEPRLGIGTLRARGQLNEVDPSRLRFSPSEAEALLNDVHGLELTPEAVGQLHDRTEGWAAGLYLAVLSVRGREDSGPFLESFAGSDRRVVDFLGGEVLAELPDDELEFLLQTSVPDRFCAPLCEALTGYRNGRAMLDRIERTNYFLIPLDPSHDWYRYHHLFRELLRHELERRRPEAVAELHRRAGHWFLEAGLMSDAISHLTAAGELDQVSDLIAAHWLPFTDLGDRAVVAGWLDALPRDHVLGDGRLCLSQARTAAVVGDHEDVLRWLDLAEAAPRYNPSEDSWRREQAIVFRSTAWELRGDLRKSEELAADLAPFDGSSFWHALAAGNLGTVAYWRDDDEEATRLLETALAANRGRIAMLSVSLLGQLAAIAADRGDWHVCADHLEAGFDLIGTHGLGEYGQAGPLHLARGRLLAHDHRPAEACAELERAADLARRGLGVIDLGYALVTLGELLCELGDRRAGRPLVLEAGELLTHAPAPGTRVPRMIARAEKTLRLVPHTVDDRKAAVTEELTPREETVLRLLPGGLSAREMGDELGVSRDTIKSHTKGIYRKLGVSDRRSAVRRARELGLL